jgi:hypothetical protein
MIPEVLVNPGLKAARREVRACAERVHRDTGCHMVAIVAEIEDGRACTSMAVDSALDEFPDTEVSLMKCALARVLSLLVLHLGREGALAAAFEALGQAARLANEAQQNDTAG